MSRGIEEGARLEKQMGWKGFCSEFYSCFKIFLMVWDRHDPSVPLRFSRDVTASYACIHICLKKDAKYCVSTSARMSSHDLPAYVYRFYRSLLTHSVCRVCLYGCTHLEICHHRLRIKNQYLILL